MEIYGIHSADCLFKWFMALLERVDVVSADTAALIYFMPQLKL